MPDELDPRKMAQDALELDKRFQESMYDPNFAWELSISNMTVATALLAALDRASELQGKLAKSGRFECCCCGEVASKSEGHRCGKVGEVGS